MKPAFLHRRQLIGEKYTFWQLPLSEVIFLL